MCPASIGRSVCLVLVPLSYDIVVRGCGTTLVRDLWYHSGMTLSYEGVVPLWYETCGTTLVRDLWYHSGTRVVRDLWYHSGTRVVRGWYECDKKCWSTEIPLAKVDFYRRLHTQAEYRSDHGGNSIGLTRIVCRYGRYIYFSG